jgi:hypothetical protein
MSQRALDEIEIVQNAGLGSVMIWKFGLGYQTETGSLSPAMPLAFLVLPIAFHAPTLDLVLSTRVGSGLALFTSKLNVDRENLLAVHARALALRELSLQSIVIGTRTQLLTIDYEHARIRANTKRAPTPPDRVSRLLGGSEKLGHWCGRLNLSQIANLLRIDF